MEFFRRIIIIFFIILFFVYQENYENYLDIVKYKDILDSKDTLFQYQLLFSRAENIYLIFYDKQRKDIYVQYKEDLYDDRNDKIKKQFIPGQPYRLTIQWIGIIKDNRFISFNQIDISSLDLTSSVMIFKFVRAEPLVIYEIHF